MPVSIFSDEFCEEQAFCYLLPEGKLGNKAPRDILISPAQYFNQRLLSICTRSVYEQHHLHSSIDFAMHKIKPGTLKTGSVKSNFKVTIKGFCKGQCVFTYEFIQWITNILETVFI